MMHASRSLVIRLHDFVLGRSSNDTRAHRHGPMKSKFRAYLETDSSVCLNHFTNVAISKQTERCARVTACYRGSCNFDASYINRQKVGMANFWNPHATPMARRSSVAKGVICIVTNKQCIGASKSERSKRTLGRLGKIRQDELGYQT